jgi:hypothetical protein
MKIKIFKDESIKNVEHEINDFLADRKDIKVVDIKEVWSRNLYIFMVLYECVGC